MSKPKISIRKILTALGWVLAGVLVVVALIAAIDRTNTANCNGIKIHFSGLEGHRFIDKQDVLVIMGAKNLNSFKGKSMVSLDLRNMENRIQQNSWVRDAELFFNSDQELEVMVKERIPVARVFTANGFSWYLDTAGKYLPLAPGKPAIELPVFTGLPEKILKKRSGDSVLLGKLLDMVDIMNKDEFWNAQVEQIVYTPEKKFELVPLIGNHRILLGDAVSAHQKFRRLKVFYTEVLSKTGLDYYDTIHAGFANQIIGSRAAGISTSVDKYKVPYNLTAAPLQVNNPISVEQTEKSRPIPVKKNVLPKPKALMQPIVNNKKQLKTI